MREGISSGLAKIRARPHARSLWQPPKQLVSFFRHLFVPNEKKEHTSKTMRLQTHSHRVLALVRQKGVVRPVDLEAIGAPRVVLTRMTAVGLLEKTGRGLYTLPDSKGLEGDSLAIIATKVPKAIFCLLTALQFHGLTTQLPRRVWITLPRGSHVPQIDYPPLKMVQSDAASYGECIEVHQRDNVALRVYSIAKTIADCFKHRNTVGLDVALEALKEAHARRVLNVDELWHCAKACRVANVIRPYVEAIQ
jgi:predicted transcriptional regulator of viral defense system